MRNGAHAETGVGTLVAVVIASRVATVVFPLPGMSTLATILLTVGGAVLILAALRDVFDVLFHETGRAVLSHGVMRAIWRAVHGVARGRAWMLSLGGPLALLGVVISWALLLILGWTLVF